MSELRALLSRIGANNRAIVEMNRKTNIILSDSGPHNRNGRPWIFIIWHAVTWSSYCFTMEIHNYLMRFTPAIAERRLILVHSSGTRENRILKDLNKLRLGLNRTGTIFNKNRGWLEKQWKLLDPHMTWKGITLPTHLNKEHKKLYCRSLFIRKSIEEK